MFNAQFWHISIKCFFFTFSSPMTASYAGSSASGGSLNTVERYDMATNRWEQAASCSTTRAGLATAVLDDQLYAAGGASDQLFGSVRRFLCVLLSMPLFCVEEEEKNCGNVRWLPDEK